MTQQQTHKALYIVSLFSIISLILVIMTVPYSGAFLLYLPVYLIGSILGVVCLFFLIVAPFKKSNMYLFSVLVIAFITSYTPYSIYRYLFEPNFSIATVGLVPGIFSDVVFFILDFTGLLFLGLRVYGYIREHKAGLGTKF